MSKGDCLKKALAQAGIDVDIPDWTLYKDMPDLCEKLGVNWHGGDGEVFIKTGEPVIVIIEHGNGKGHATFTKDVKQAPNIIGLITFTS